MQDEDPCGEYSATGDKQSQKATGKKKDSIGEKNTPPEMGKDSTPKITTYGIYQHIVETKQRKKTPQGETYQCKHQLQKGKRPEREE